jgi:hypothetical protein
MHVCQWQTMAIAGMSCAIRIASSIIIIIIIIIIHYKIREIHTKRVTASPINAPIHNTRIVGSWFVSFKPIAGDKHSSINAACSVNNVRTIAKLYTYGERDK